MATSPVADLGPEAMVGSYRLVREIGRGGMGVVFEAKHAMLARRAAIKIMHAELRKHPGMATRMVQEATILEDVRHPGVVRVYDCNVLADLRPWIAMELVEGETLADKICLGGPLAALEVATLLTEISDVLASVHARGVVHRDLKPDNILLTPCDRDFRLRVIDWGVARLGPQGRLTLEGLTPGTPIYMSPEQAMGRDIAAPCDIYSLGVMAYEMFTGRPPFDGRTLAEVLALHLNYQPPPLAELVNAPPELSVLVRRMLDKDPAARPGAIEVRQLARSIAFDLAAGYESFEIIGVEGFTPPGPELAPPIPAELARGSDTVIAADVLERGVTELVPTLPKPRWTPELQAPVPPRPVPSPSASASMAMQSPVPQRKRSNRKTRRRRR